MSGADRETLERLRCGMENASDQVKQFLAGYAKGLMDAMELQKKHDSAA